MNKIAFFIILSFVSFKLKSQELEEKKQAIIEQRVDFLLDINEGGDADFTTLFELLEVYYNHPINLNNVKKIDLDNLGLLNDIQVNNLLIHLEQHGKLITFEELQTVEGFDTETIKVIRPFTTINGNLDQTNISFSNLLKEGSSSLFLRYTRNIEEQVGFSNINSEKLAENPNQRYLGSADKLFTRYRFNYANNFSAGFTGEKDAGEEFFQGTQANGFDFYSAHLFIQGFGVIKQLALGDFQAQFGQGLTFWSGLAFGRSPSVFTLKRNATKLKPYTSVQEDLFLRGGGITLEKNNVELTLFYSSKNQDANITGFDTLNNETIISSLSEDGFHRTLNELKDKNVIQTAYLGGNLNYVKRNFSIGLTAVYNTVGAALMPRTNNYNQFNQLDNDNLNYGLDFSYLYKNINTFGEVSKSIDGGYAYTLGALTVLDPRFSVGIQRRNFQRDFKPIQSNAISESSSNTNERGTFIGLEAKLSKHLSLSAYTDHFVFPWLRFQTDAPSSGNSLFTQFTYKPSKNLEAYFRFRKRTRERNETKNIEGIDQVVEEKNSTYRLHFSYQVSKNIKLKNRIEYTIYQLGDNQSENGFLIYQDLSFKKLSFPFSFSLRYALFDTDSYDSRIYAFENDVLYAFSIPAYSGKGTRFYITTKYHIKRNVDLWIRYSETYYTDRDFIGSGKDMIVGNTKSEIKAQLRVKF